MPGVIFNEFVASQQDTPTVEFGVGVVGGASWGPINRPLRLTTDADIVAAFGKPTTTDLGLTSAIAVVRRGGVAYYNRVASASAAKSAVALAGRTITTPAVAGHADIAADGSNTAAADGDSITLIDADSRTLVFEFDTNGTVASGAVPVTPGATAAAGLKNLEIAVNAARQRNAIGLNAVFSAGDNTLTLTQTKAGAGGNTAITADVTPTWTVASAFTGGVTEVASAVAAAVTVQALYEGVVGDTVKVEVVQPSTAPGAVSNSFDLKVYVPPAPGAVAELVETFRNLTRTAGANYVVDVLANGRPGVNAASNYIRAFVGASATTLNTAAPASLSGGNDGLDLVDTDYIGSSLGTSPTGIQALSSTVSFPIVVLIVPGVTTNTVIDAAVAFAKGRADCMYFMDLPIGVGPDGAGAFVDGQGAIFSAPDAPTSMIDEKDAAVFYPREKTFDGFNRVDVLLPSSASAAATYAAAFATIGLGAPVAGVPDGVSGKAAGLEVIMSQAQSNKLHNTHQVNPIIQVGTRAVIFGNRTLSRALSPNQNLHVRFGLIGIKRLLAAAGLEVGMKPNNAGTWTKLQGLVTPGLDQFVARGVLERYSFVVNASTNPEEQRRRKMLRSRLLLKFTDISEDVAFDIAVTDTEATFTEAAA